MALSGLRAQVACWGATPPQYRGYCSLDFENTVHVAEFRKIPDAGGVLRDNRVVSRRTGVRSNTRAMTLTGPVVPQACPIPWSNGRPKPSDTAKWAPLFVQRALGPRS